MWNNKPSLPGLTVCSRFATILTNYAHKHLKYWSTCVWQEVTTYILSLLMDSHMIVFTKYAVLGLICFMEASSVLYSRFPPQKLPSSLTISSYWYYAYLVSLTLICCTFSECMPVQNKITYRKRVEIIRDSESVDSLHRDGTDAQYMQYL